MIVSAPSLALARAIASRSEIRPSPASTTSSERGDDDVVRRLEGAEVGDVGAVVGDAGESSREKPRASRSGARLSLPASSAGLVEAVFSAIV